jgi:clan AA aspartic protease
VVRLSVRGSSGASTDVDVVLDTGFTESLTLPPALIASLQLPPRGTADFKLADGGSVRLRVFRGSVFWQGQPRVVLVIETDGPALVGMEMLQGCRVTLDVVDGGDVTIEPLP